MLIAEYNALHTSIKTSKEPKMFLRNILIIQLLLFNIFNS